MAPMDRFPKLSVSADHVAPPSVVFQTPPPAVPRYTIFRFVGWTTSADTRPARFVGPMLVHVGPGTPPAMALGVPRAVPRPNVAPGRCWPPRTSGFIRKSGSELAY